MMPSWFGFRAREIAIALLLVMTTRTCLAAPLYVSSGSMQPTLLIGDHMVAESFAYGFSTVSFPYGETIAKGGRLWGRIPRRGDIVVFRGPAGTGETWVKRVIGLPGDRIALREGRVILNGEIVPWIDRGGGSEELQDGLFEPARRIEERLPGGTTHLLLKTVWHGAADTMAERTVPPGTLFVMGDNRDNSADSRFPVAAGGVGFLPLWNLRGRVRLVTMSRDIEAPGRGPSSWLNSLRPDRTALIVH